MVWRKNTWGRPKNGKPSCGSFFPFQVTEKKDLFKLAWQIAFCVLANAFWLILAWAPKLPEHDECRVPLVKELKWPNFICMLMFEKHKRNNRQSRAIWGKNLKTRLTEDCFRCAHFFSLLCFLRTLKGRWTWPQGKTTAERGLGSLGLALGCSCYSIFYSLQS